jgi:hypothetical protein
MPLASSSVVVVASGGGSTFSSVTINVETFSKTKKIGPGTDAGPYFEDASDTGFDPGNSVN